MRAAATAALLLLFAPASRAGKPRPANREKPAPLYTRLGGVYGVAEIADAWVDRMWDDEALLKNEALKAARDRLTKAAVKFHLAIELCRAAGGPCEFKGKGGAPQGTDLKLGPDEWHAIRNHLGEILIDRKIERPDADALLAIVDAHILKASRVANDFAYG